MNAFFEHHKDNIRSQYHCFDRLLLNGLIQPFQQPERVIGFFNSYREGKRVTRGLLTDIADQFRDWIAIRSEKWGVPILDARKVAGISSWTPTFNEPKPMRLC